IVLLDWLPPDHLGGKSRQFLPRKHPAEILALGPSCASHRRSSNANSLMRPEFGWITGICATFQRDILRRHFGVRVASQAVRSLSASGMKGSQSIWAFEPPAGGLFR